MIRICHLFPSSLFFFSISSETLAAKYKNVGGLQRLVSDDLYVLRTCTYSSLRYSIYIPGTTTVRIIAITYVGVSYVVQYVQYSTW